jgi:integrase
MRRGEALSLRWRDVDLERAAVAVRRTFARLIREARTV